MPVRYIHRTVARTRLPACTAPAASALVTPLRDGMNLVAKEFIAAQDPADPGVLVLSRFAGAAEQLKEALLVNPYDTEGTAGGDPARAADAAGRAAATPPGAADHASASTTCTGGATRFLQQLGQTEAEETGTPWLRL